MGEFLDEIIIRVSVHEFWTGTDIRTLPVPPTPVAGEWSTDGAPRMAVPYGGGVASARDEGLSTNRHHA